MAETASAGRDLEGQVAVVAGGAAGIGRATAELLARQGARVALLDVLDQQGRELAEQLRSWGTEALFRRCDVTQREEVEGAIQAALDHFGGIDILANIAGGSKTVWFWEMSEEQWDAMLNLNLKATFLSCRAVIPHMLERKRGSIVNLSSCQGVAPAPQRAHYSAAKAGIIGFTRTVAYEVAPHGVRVNVVAPGPTATERVRNNYDEEGWAKLNAEQPIGRVSEPQDIAEAIAFLAGPRSRQVTGQVLHVNGGLVMP